MNDNETIHINIDLDALVAKICRDPGALRAIAEAIRNTQTKQSRNMNNLYGRTAQQTPPPPTSRSRLT